MYLGKLSNEQKNLFLDLCVHGANANNNFADEEKEMVNAYCTEMQIPVRYNEENSLDECMEKLIKISSKEELRAILVELTALILSDNIYDAQEKQFMEKFVKQIGVTDSEYENVHEMLGKLSTLYKEMNEFVAGV